jgi:hypothetical protein
VRLIRPIGKRQTGHTGRSAEPTDPALMLCRFMMALRTNTGGSAIGLSATDARRFVIVFSVGDAGVCALFERIASPFWSHRRAGRLGLQSKRSLTGPSSWTRRCRRTSTPSHDHARTDNARRPTAIVAVGVGQLREVPAPCAARVRRGCHPLVPGHFERQAAPLRAMHRLRPPGRHAAASWVGRRAHRLYAVSGQSRLKPLNRSGASAV